MKFKFKYLIPAFLILIAIFAFYYKISYHGHAKSSSFKPRDRINRDEVAREAKKLKGILYDPFQGKYNNIGGKLGFIVCIDVPRLAYENAGYSIGEEMKADYKMHPEHYDTRDWNIPDNPFFSRRARNLYDYCKGNGRLIALNGEPRPGDVVFYSRGTGKKILHIALITKINLDGTYEIMESAPETILSKETTNEEIEARGWAPVAFGRIID